MHSHKITCHVSLNAYVRTY